MPAADVALTVEMVAAGQLLDIELLDHLIIGQGRSCAVAGRLRGARAECLP
jgi:DNA repair protein RadC